MIYKPHRYQDYAKDFIIDHPEAAVFLDCGMGKSILTLTAIDELMYDRFEIRKVLVIAPLRVARVTWPQEIEKWSHTNYLTYSVIAGTPKQRMAAATAPADIYIVNRENVTWLIEKSGLPFDYDMIVVDELSSFKSADAKRFKSLMKVRPLAKRVVGLTGTPSSNGLMDLWAEFKLLDMGKRLGKFKSAYTANYFRPDRMNGYIVYTYRPLPGAEQRIYDQISDITISMAARDYLEMPERIDSNVSVELSEKESIAYKEMKKDLILTLPDGEITASNAAALSGKLMQMANGAVYTDDGDVVELHTRKIDALEDLLEAANGKPILVAYWYKHDLERIKERLDKIGATYELINTDDSIRRWNRKEIPVGLIHPASAGHGLNLQDGSNTIIWFGLTWSLELYQQLNARLWRQGQKDKTVIVQHIITKGSIDEKVLKALQEKDTTQKNLIEAVKADLGGMTYGK